MLSPSMQLEHFSATQVYCFGAFPEAQLWLKERSLHLQRTIHSCQKLAVCGTQSTAAVFPEYWQLLWQPESFTSTGISEALSKKLSILYACIFHFREFFSLLLLFYSTTHWIIFLKLGNYKVWTFEIICFLSPGIWGFKLPDWTEALKSIFLFFWNMYNCICSLYEEAAAIFNRSHGNISSQLC